MKVFLSSTYNDLLEHRQAAHDALEQLGLHVIWMEAFGTRPEESTQACFKEIEACELFVGIYAHRYGYIPAGAQRSITEQEFDHAQSLGKPIFAFIVHEDHPWPPRFIEHDQRAKLDAFLSKVRKRPVEFFTTPDNLAQNIASSIGRYLAEINFNRQSKIVNRQSKIVNRQSKIANPAPPSPASTSSSGARRNSPSSPKPSPPKPAPGAPSLTDPAASARPPSPSKPPTRRPPNASRARFSSPPRCAN